MTQSLNVFIFIVLVVVIVIMKCKRNVLSNFLAQKANVAQAIHG